MNRFHLDDSYNQHERGPNISQIQHCNAGTSQIPLQEQPYRLENETENVMKANSTNPEED